MNYVWKHKLGGVWFMDEVDNAMDDAPLSERDFASACGIEFDHFVYLFDSAFAGATYDELRQIAEFADIDLAYHIDIHD